MSRQQQPDRNPDQDTQSALLAEIHKLNALMTQRISQQNSPWLALRNGLLTGLGGTVGAALLVSILINLLRPFDQLTPIKDALERLSRQGRTYSR